MTEPTPRVARDTSTAECLNIGNKTSCSPPESFARTHEAVACWRTTNITHVVQQTNSVLRARA